MARMKAAGIEIDTIADKTPFQEAVKPVWDKYGAKYTDLIKRIQAVKLSPSRFRADRPRRPADTGASVATPASRARGMPRDASDPRAPDYEGRWPRASGALRRAMDALYRALRRYRRRGAGADLGGDPVGRLYALCAQQRRVLAGADGDPVEIVLTFFGAAACYRAGVHMSVTVAARPVPPLRRRVIDLSPKG